MVEIKDRIRRARLKVAVEAAARWAARAPARERSGGRVDTPKRQGEFEVREAARGRAQLLHARGLLPMALERRIGPTLDLSFSAPSEAARKAGRPVARITPMPPKGVEPLPIATGFMVSPRLLITNHHVLTSEVDARGRAANFLYEYSDGGLALGRYHALDPDAFFHADEELDFALVAVQPVGRDGEPLAEVGFTPLIEATPKILIGQPANIIQHPDGRAKSYAVTQNRLLDVLDAGFLHYETDTLAGSSGSPVFNANWELVALHHSGIPQITAGQVLDRAGHVWNPEQQSDDDVMWVANEGVRVSSIVRRLASLHMSPAQQPLLDQLLADTSDPLRAVEAAVASNPVLAATGAAMSNNVFNFSGPVTIHVYAPGGAPSAQASGLVSITGADVALEKKQNFDPDYDNRPGYDPGFLGLTIPLPGVAAARLAEMKLDAAGKPLVLRYHHFSLAMNAKRRLCMWTASNADYSAAMRDDRPRKAFGGEDWKPDPRLADAEQILNEDFYGPATRIDRGHIVRRDDNCWGATPLEREYGNADSYHWTNCTPQHEAFNQEHAQGAEYVGVPGLWGGLESQVVRQLNGVGDKATQFAGPVLDNTADPRKDFGTGAIQYPLRFWKVVAVMAPDPAGDKLRVYGFVLDQTAVIKKFGLEGIFDPGAFKAFQTPLADIAALAGVTFPKIMMDNDVRAATTGDHPIAGVTDLQH